MPITSKSNQGKVKNGFWTGIGIAVAGIVVAMVWVGVVRPQVAKVVTVPSGI